MNQLAQELFARSREDELWVGRAWLKTYRRALRTGRRPVVRSPRAIVCAVAIAAAGALTASFLIPAAP